jgi:hypothetical protein
MLGLSNISILNFVSLGSIVSLRSGRIMSPQVSVYTDENRVSQLITQMSLFNSCMLGSSLSIRGIDFH